MPELYLSGSLGSTKYRTRIYEQTPNRLLSLHGSYLTVARDWLRGIGDARDTSNMSVMFDSGAFTAWSKNEADPDVNHLLRVYKRALSVCEKRFKDVWFISLDKIPGSPGRTATHDEIVEAVKKSDSNHAILRSELGDRVLPVFHQSEPVERLHEVVELNPSYICVSPRNDLSEQYRRTWSQRTHDLIPNVNTHGLAATGGAMMLDVPWRSVDSASWVMISSYGMVLIPVDGTIKTVAVSEHSSNKRIWGQHLDTMGPQAIKIVDSYCAKLELTKDELRTQSGARELFNVHVMRELSTQSHRKVPIPLTLFAL
jgi:hypothetical protein